MKAKKTVRPAPRVEVTPEERYRLINDAAYFRSVRRAKPGAGAQDGAAEVWCEVEAEIDTVLKQHRVK
jgi:hypothetical protein